MPALRRHNRSRLVGAESFEAGQMRHPSPVCRVSAGLVLFVSRADAHRDNVQGLPRGRQTAEAMGCLRAQLGRLQRSALSEVQGKKPNRSVDERLEVLLCDVRWVELGLDNAHFWAAREIVSSENLRKRKLNSFRGIVIDSTVDGSIISRFRLHRGASESVEL